MTPARLLAWLKEDDLEDGEGISAPSLRPPRRGWDFLSLGTVREVEMK